MDTTRPGDLEPMTTASLLDAASTLAHLHDARAVHTILACAHNEIASDHDEVWCETCFARLDPNDPTRPLLLCGTCEDYVDDPALKRHGNGWRHQTNNSVRCPGQEDDDTDDRAEPALGLHDQEPICLSGDMLAQVLQHLR